MNNTQRGMIKLLNVSRVSFPYGNRACQHANAFSCTATSTDVDSRVEIGSHADNNNSVDSEIRKGDIPGTISGSMGRHFLIVGNAIEGKSDEEPLC